MRHCGLILLAALLLAGCSVNTRNGDALSAHHTAEKVKDGWLKMSKPLEIEVMGRTKSELEEIGSLAVWLGGMEDGKAVEFRFDGKVFKPSVPVMADSTASPLVCYPFLPSLHPADTVAVSHPFGERLAGQIQSVTQTNDKTKITMKLEELTALLRLILKSDNISDVMQFLEIQGDCVSTAGFLIPLKGRLDSRQSDTDRVCSVLSDCLLNNGIPHDFNLIPTEDSGEIHISLKVNGKKLSISTTLPPLRRGSITELRLHVSGGRLSLGSSWVDTRHPFERPAVARTDSVKTGYFLQKDGTISPKLDGNSLAWVIKTDVTERPSLWTTTVRVTGSGRNLSVPDTCSRRRTAGCVRDISVSRRRKKTISCSVPASNIPATAHWDSMTGRHSRSPYSATRSDTI